MKSIKFSCILMLLFFSMIFALESAKANFEQLPKLRGDEPLPAGRPIPYNGVRQYLPGADSIIGYTSYELQRSGSFGQRIMVDDFGQAHIDWMWSDYPNQDERLCTWNARFDNGSYYGMVPASPSWSGYVQLDITRDVNPDSQRTVIAYHYNAGAGTMPWIDIDQGNLWGVLPNDPKGPEVADHVWLVICVASNNNIIMVTGDSYTSSSMHHLYLTTDQGVTWSTSVDFDSCTTVSQSLRGSRNPGSQKVVHVWTQTMDLSTVSQWCMDVYYELSTDNGANWGSPVNITNYTPPASMNIGDSAIWAFNNTIAVFDTSDNLHIAWGGHLAWVSAGDTLYGGDRAKIFHWSEATGTISTVSSPSTYYTEPNGFWLEPWVNGAPYYHSGAAGSWRTMCDEPQLVVDPTNNDLYCLWHGNDDSTDVALNNYINGELYGAYSNDNGLTWTDYVNLTNTRTPGAGPGDCFDEDYMTACPFLINDSLFITYIEDKDACAFAHAGEMTDNPVHCWVFNKNLITGITEENALGSEYANPALEVYPNPFTKTTEIRWQIPDIQMQETGSKKQDVSLKIYDVSGRLVKSFLLPTFNFSLPTSIMWHGDDNSGCKLAPGVYFVRLETDNHTEVKKAILLR
ncbi:T9SS type A sorting domain-containing protein [candidate division WOR-3 bacterium]|nr:T9SS type A sorting domain-containing protein [candidate division WOR-3 bacterium]